MIDSVTLLKENRSFLAFNRFLMRFKMSDIEVQNKLESVKEGANTKFLIYILPDEWYFSDIPMNMPEGDIERHRIQRNGNKNYYKVLINKADLKPSKDAEGREIEDCEWTLL